jgi:hypothetical protein
VAGPNLPALTASRYSLIGFWRRHATHDSRNCSSATLIWKLAAIFISVTIRLSHAPPPSRITRLQIDAFDDLS